MGRPRAVGGSLSLSESLSLSLSCVSLVSCRSACSWPQASPVWEITGAEFTQNEVHTADGISVRFPRVTKIRDDKGWEQATSLPELRVSAVRARPPGV